MSEDTDREQILETNKRFYRALGTRDLDLMGTVWVKDERVGCVHPGWVMLRGWHALMQSWENVFDPEDQLDIRLHNLTVDIRGDVAWVTCIQELRYVRRDPVTMNVSVSTNIFEKQKDGWLMLIHHASPLPQVNYEAEDNQLQ